MANILDYLDWRGDLSLSVSPFNEVDGLILSELAYLDLTQILDGKPRPQLSLYEVRQAYEALGREQKLILNDPKPLLLRAAASKRFGNMRLGAYIDEVDPERELQLSAVTFFLEDGTACVSYRGTDSSIVGWREDFNFSYQNHTAGQIGAVRYLEAVADATKTLPLRISGHSKGGNFAVYAAAFCRQDIRDNRILHVYSHDAPGFNREVAHAPEIQHILKKTDVIIPESSMVGILLSTKKEKQLVKSSGSGLYQHNPYTWQTLGTHFENAEERTGSSLFMDETLHRWLDSLDTEQRADFVRAVFDSMESSGATNMHELRTRPMTSLNAIVNAVKTMDPELQRSAGEALKKLAAVWSDTMRADLLRYLEKLGIDILPGSKEALEK